MTPRSTAERIVIWLGAIVGVVALALLGLAAYVLVGPAGLDGSNGLYFGVAVFAALVGTILYASDGFTGFFEAEYRRGL